MSFVNRSRTRLQPYLPPAVLGLGALAKIALKTGGFARQGGLRRETAGRLGGAGGGPLPLGAYERRLLSQNGEDGILEAIFQIIGWRSRKVVEFGFAATEANLLNLAIAHDLDGYFLDGSAATCAMAAAMFGVMRRRRLRVSRAFITAETINEAIGDAGVSGEIDALSIDVDGNDYWLWRALTVVNPRLVVAEYNDRLGAELAVTIAYDPGFDAARSPHEVYQGASLAALARLAAARGYRLIGCDGAGVNAFFLRDDVAAAALPAVGVAEAFRYHARSAGRGAPAAVIAGLPFVHV